MARRKSPSPTPWSDASLVLHLAQKYQVRSVQQARGTCFSASLELAREARSLGVEVELLNWRVRGDPDFVDHWAVRYMDAMAIDLTSAQFDAKAPLLYPLHKYPNSFDRLREYPAGLFLALYSPSAATSPRLTSGFMLQAGFRMWRHDVVQALSDMDANELISATWRFGHMATVLGLLRLRQSAHRRLKALQGRMR